MANLLEWLGRSGAQSAGTAGLSPLTTANPSGGFLSSRSELSDSLQQGNISRASAAMPMAQPDPGNTLSNALQVGTLDTTPKTFSDAVGALDRNDYYQFSVSDRTNLNLSLQGLSANANLQLLSGNGTLLNRSTRTGTANEAISQALEPGTYYVQVYAASGTTNYTLGLSSSPIAASTPTPAPTPTDFVQQVLALTNQFRSQNGVAPLTLNLELNATALGHSQDMAQQDYFSHTGKDGSAPWDRAKEVGYEARTIGENIAAGYTTPEAVVEGWKNSPGHRANMLNPNFTELGVGYYDLANDTGSVNYNRYWTQVFGSGDLNPATNLPVT